MPGTISIGKYEENDIQFGAMFSIPVEFTANETDGSVGSVTCSLPFGSFAADIDFISDDSFTVGVTLKTIHGVVAHPNDTISIENNKRYILNDRPTLIGGFEITITTAGAGDAGKNGTVRVNLASNKR